MYKDKRIMYMFYNYEIVKHLVPESEVPCFPSHMHVDLVFSYEDGFSLLTFSLLSSSLPPFLFLSFCIIYILLCSYIFSKFYTLQYILFTVEQFFFKKAFCGQRVVRMQNWTVHSTGPALYPVSWALCPVSRLRLPQAALSISAGGGRVGSENSVGAVANQWLLPVDKWRGKGVRETQHLKIGWFLLEL